MIKRNTTTKNGRLLNWWVCWTKEPIQWRLSVGFVERKTGTWTIYIHVCLWLFTTFSQVKWIGLINEKHIKTKLPAQPISRNTPCGSYFAWRNSSLKLFSFRISMFFQINRIPTVLVEHKWIHTQYSIGRWRFYRWNLRYLKVQRKSLPTKV